VDLLDGEEILWRGRPSWRSMVGWYLRWAVLALTDRRIHIRQGLVSHGLVRLIAQIEVRQPLVRQGL
jgi:hypothetical protein